MNEGVGPMAWDGGGDRGAGGHAAEVASGRRFAFGRNWRDFIDGLTEERIGAAARSLAGLLGRFPLEGRTFLDVGCGSGLFSLAALRLGASAVRSFDYDPDSVACALELSRRYLPGDRRWTIGRGSILDDAFVGSLEPHDVVYAWGVLHHTGAMWRALENVRRPLRPGGLLVLALYNDQGAKSRLWLRVKELYCRTPRVLRAPLFSPIPAFYGLKGMAERALGIGAAARAPSVPADRGMSARHDWADWLGGLPFEVAKPGEVVAFFQERGLSLEKLSTCGGGSGNNEYVFRLPRTEGAEAA